MRVIETIHPNTQVRTFTCDKVISEIRISDYSRFSGEKSPSEEVLDFYKNLTSILLVNEVSVDKYSVRIEIEEAFEDNETDWGNIRFQVLDYIAQFFEVPMSPDYIEHSIKNDKNRYKEDVESEVISISGLKEFVAKVTIPHDFKTHKQAWRGAIVDKMNSYSELPDPEGRFIYWQNELVKFDTAFAKLLALNLPQDD